MQFKFIAIPAGLWHLIWRSSVLVKRVALFRICSLAFLLSHMHPLRATFSGLSGLPTVLSSKIAPHLAIKGLKKKSFPYPQGWVP